MSNSDYNHTIVPDYDSPPPSVARTFSRTLNAEVEEYSAIPCKKKGDGIQATKREDFSNSVVQEDNENEVM